MSRAAHCRSGIRGDTMTQCSAPAFHYIFPRVRSTTYTSADRCRQPPLTWACCTTAPSPARQNEPSCRRIGAVRRAGSPSPPSAPRQVRAARPAPGGLAWTACPDLCGPRPGSCWRAVAVAPAARVVGDGSRRMLDEVGDEVGQPQARALAEALHPAGTPCLFPSRCKPRHCII